ncbi:MAG: G8 domain-containing protein [Planctomycetes bacterium]|nr:G8 domain-containing protein [Planctomycetota bacterium]
MPAIASSLLLLVAACLTGAAGTAAEPAPWIKSARSGEWSAAATWEGGAVPAAGARVFVRAGHVVQYDVKSTDTIRAVHVAGTLTFAHDRDTQLNVGVLKIEAGEFPSEQGFDCDAHLLEMEDGAVRAALEVGTPDQPIPANHTALIRLAAVEGQDKQSCPAIVCCGGRMDFHGAPLSRTWLKLGATAGKGETHVTLDEPVTGWRVGDRVIVTATHLGRDIGQGTDRLQTEERTITAVDGARITLNEPLVNAHLGEGDFRGEVANLSRNVIVESASPEGERGHTMYHRGSAGSISYAEFRHLGKRNVLGRYSLHFHLVGNTMRGSSVIGTSIWDSHNRWLTIHGTNYLLVRDCVGYQSIGHGFFMEDGTEVYNILDRNLAVQSMEGKKLPKQVLPFDQNEGSGFWWANSFNTFTRNVACENNRYGYRFEATQTSALKMTLPVLQADGKIKETDIRTLPFVQFEDNEAHCDGLYGINLGEGVNRVGPDERHPFVMRNTKIWEIHYAFRVQSPSVLVENMQIHKSVYGVYHPNFDRHVYRNVTISQSDRNGDAEPFNRGHDDDSVQFGSLTVDGLTFVGHQNSSMPLIQLSDDNPTGTAETHMKNVSVLDRKDGNRRALINLGGGPRPNPKSPTSVPVILHDYYGSGRHAKVASMKSGEFKTDPSAYKSDPPLTGDESRVTEVRDVPFPELLKPIDDQPPATVITRVRRVGEAWQVSGVAEDNGQIQQLVVNGQPARSIRGNFAEWDVTLKSLPANAAIMAFATDAAGNVEQIPHTVHVAP